MEHLNRPDDEDDTYRVPYRPAERQRHEWEELFSDIPMSATARKTRGGEVWTASEPALYLPQTAARIAQHAELVGMVYDPDRAKMRRARLATGVHVWVDVSVTLPNEVSRVEATVAALADATTADERRELAERLLSLDEEDS